MCLGQHGILVLQICSLDVRSTHKHMAEATSLHFDAVQAHSGQMLMPAAHFSLVVTDAVLVFATSRSSNLSGTFSSFVFAFRAGDTLAIRGRGEAGLLVVRSLVTYRNCPK